MSMILCVGMPMFLVACNIGGTAAVRDGKEAFARAPQGLRQAYVAYWQARARNAHKETFSLEAPYFQETVPFPYYETYLKLFEKAGLQSIRPCSVDCRQPFSCRVETDIEYLGTSRAGQDIRQLSDCWVQAGGKWWHVVRNPLVFSEFSMGPLGPPVDKPVDKLENNLQEREGFYE